MGYIYNLSPINGRPGLVVTWRSCHKGFIYEDLKKYTVQFCFVSNTLHT